MQLFQFTSSYRGWRPWDNETNYDADFNSHPHIEDDSDADQTVDYPKVFQFTSSYRGWPNPALMDHWFSLFQFTSSYRGWRASGFFFYRTEKFQFTSSYRGWLYWLVLNPTVFQFQFTSSYRGWPILKLTDSNRFYFNSHPHIEDDIRWQWTATQ